MLTEVIATRYVTPLREGGSLPGIVEADDLGTYIMKFTGAGQGRKTLVAEVIAGQLGRRLGLRVPDLVRMQLDPVIGLSEPDQEVQELLKASGGLNLGMDYLPGSLGFDPLGFEVSAREAGRVVWFDALINNVDRSWRNPNLLVWHGELWLIDHGASMIWHHNWPGAEKSAARPYDASDHVLATFGPDVAAAASEFAPLVTEDLLTEIAADVPDEWLAGEPGFDSPDELRRVYVTTLLARAGAISDHITIGAPSKDQPSQAPEWLAGKAAAEGSEVSGLRNGRDVFEYALLRVVPRVERGEMINAGVVVYCHARRFVEARTHLDEARLLALDPTTDVAGVRAALGAVEGICLGGERAGQAAGDDVGRRFRWLIAPRSTIVQPGPVHSGLTTDPSLEAERLLELLVR